MLVERLDVIPKGRVNRFYDIDDVFPGQGRDAYGVQSRQEKIDEPVGLGRIIRRGSFFDDALQ